MTADEIDALTIAEVRAICERASDAMEQLRALGLMPYGRAVAPTFHGGQPSTVANGQIVVQPFPCRACGRVAPEKSGEPLQTLQCQTCGNHLPGTTPLTNKGAIHADCHIINPH